MDDLLGNLAKKFGQTSSAQIGQAVEEMVTNAIMRRRGHERRWYDNNFFDDGYHFRTISRKTGRVIDHTSRSSGYVERAIPRASRQIRGVSNLLYAAEPYPVVYPQRISTSNYPKVPDPKTGQMTTSPEYDQAMEQAKDVARRQGIWLTTEWDEKQQLPLKMIDLILLAMKNSVSWLQVYSDTDKQEIITEVYDAFDVICFGDKRSAKELPFLTKTCSIEVDEAKNDPRFDPAMTSKLTPDNRYATSEIKDAYMRTRFGSKTPGADNEKGTLILKETFMKEILSEDNWKQAIKLGQDNGALEGKSKGDSIMRHIYSAAAVTLKDEYVDYDDYPLVPYRMEPGPLYQVPFIERFIPQNKSLDVIVTRLEKWVNAMVVGVYQKRKDENFEVSNFPGGQVVEYETTPLQQMQNATVGNTPFEVINLLNKYLEEQGSTTAALGQIPTGVKSGIAIESVKSTEYANLKIATMMLKQTIKEVAERMLERAHKDFLEPQEVESLEDGEPNYFDVIGKRGYDLSQKVNKALPDDVVVLDKSTKVRIEIEPGLGLTMEGKRQAMQSIIEYILKLSQTVPGVVTPEALQQIIKRFLETFGYGSTQELMEAMEEGMTMGQMSDEQIKQMQIAIAQTMKDLDMTGPQVQSQMVDTTKVGVLEALKQSGIADKILSEDQVTDNPELDAIPYKDAPDSIKRQMESKAGLQPAFGEDTPVEVDQKIKAASVGITHQANEQKAGISQQTVDQQQAQHRDKISLQASQGAQSAALQEKALKQKAVKPAAKK